MTVVTDEQSVDRSLAGMPALRIPMDCRHIDLRPVCLRYGRLF